MLHDLTRRLRRFLSARCKETGGVCARCADKESALLWMQQQGVGNKFLVAVTVPAQQSDGTTDADKRAGMAVATVRIYIGLAPGAPADADKRAEDLMLTWALVWSWISRLRFGTVTDTDKPGVKQFVPLDGYLDGNKSGVPGKAEFSRSTFKVADSKDIFELLLAQQDWTFGIAMTQVTAGPSDTGGNFYFDS